jgi:UDP-glucose:glycoprotein glucosyltransferase
LNSTIVSLYLNPSLHLTEVPIKRFYEFCFASKLTFSPSGAELQPQVRFDAIPPDVLVTYATDLQRAWLAFPRTGIHDLDNIKLGDLPLDSRERGVEAVLELETLIVEGHARDMPSSRPPRGLQLELSRPGSLNAAADRTASIVMANLGYVQLKANPGLWRLDIRSGRSADVFELESIGADGWKSAEVAKTGNEFFVSTLEGKTIYPRFRRRPGHETTELLDESAAEAVKDKTATLGIWNRVKSMYVPVPRLTSLSTVQG